MRRNALVLTAMLGVLSACGAVSDEAYWSERRIVSGLAWLALAVNGFAIAAAVVTIIRSPRWAVFLVAPFALFTFVVSGAALFQYGHLADVGDLAWRELPIALLAVGPGLWFVAALVRRFEGPSRRIAAIVIAPFALAYVAVLTGLSVHALPKAPPGAPLVLLECKDESEALFDDGSVWVWNGSRHAPRRMDLKRATDLACGCALQADGDVRCWDAGDPSTRGGVLSNVVRIAGTPSRTCALHASGHVACFHGSDPPEDVDGVSDAVAISVADSHACAARRGGFVTCWGDRDEAAATAPLRDVVEVAVGEEHGCARNSAGIVMCWGDGVLGDGTTSSSSSPIPVLRDVAQIGAGARHTCARMNDGAVLCWGEGELGQTGSGGTGLTPPNPVLRPTPVTLARPARSIVVAPSHVCARSDRTFECWGDDRMDALRTGVSDHCSDDDPSGGGTCTPTPHSVTFVE